MLSVHSALLEKMNRKSFTEKPIKVSKLELILSEQPGHDYFTVSFHLSLSYFSKTPHPLSKFYL